jgi:hypothetical protein
MAAAASLISGLGHVRLLHNTNAGICMKFLWLDLDCLRLCWGGMYALCHKHAVKN